jgi:dephospho-CoA kinase
MRVGLTGGIGSGKSTVSALLAERGAIVVDADAIARAIVEPGEPALSEIAEAFGAEVIGPDGALDRARLAALVFGDPDALERLNAITHPRIAQRSAEMIAQAPTDAVVVYDMPLLVEQGPDALTGWDHIAVVDCPDDVRLGRLVARGMDADDARRRMASQATREERIAVADTVIDNSRDLASLTGQVDSLWDRLRGAGA